MCSFNHVITFVPLTTLQSQSQFGPDDTASITADQQHTILEQATNFLDRNPCVERYACFGSADGDESLLANGVGPALSSLGKQHTYGNVMEGDQTDTNSTGINGNNSTIRAECTEDVRKRPWPCSRSSSYSCQSPPTPASQGVLVFCQSQGNILVALGTIGLLYKSIHGRGCHKNTKPVGTEV